MQNLTQESRINVPVFLIGMPGSGKSALGRGLANIFNVDFIDTDRTISDQYEKSIEELFLSNGEDFFRLCEHKWINAYDARPHVVSTGGGFPIYNDNLLRLKAKGLVVFVDTPLHAIAERLELSHQVRPMFIGLSEVERREKLKKVYQSRMSIYLQAHIHFVSSANLSIPQNVLNLSELVLSYIKYASA